MSKMTLVRPLTEGRRFLESTVLSKTADTVTLSWFTEAPIEMPYGMEMLRADGCDLSRLNAGAPLLWNHNPNTVLGVIESAWVSGGKGYATIRWSSKPEVQGHRQDVEDGVLPGVSCGYSVTEYETQADGTIVVTAWTPTEISIAPIPADLACGVGRSLDNSNHGGLKMPSAVRRQQQLLEDDRLRIASIKALGEKYAEQCGQRSLQLAETLLEEEATIEYARSQFLELVTTTNTQQPISYGVDPLIGGHHGRRSMTGSPLGLSRSEAQGYSMCRAILGAAGLIDKDEAGFEFECSRALSRSLNYPTKGLLIPIAELTNPQQRGFQVGTPSAGGNLVETAVASANFIDILRNASKCIGLGVTQINDCVGNVAVPRRTGASTAYWVTEDQGITESTGAFDQVLLQPRQLGALTRFSRLMLQQALPDIEALVRADFAQILALALDSAIINGSGASGQPRGILQTPGIQSLALGTNGAAITFERLTEMVRMLRSQNADGDRVAWLLNPNVCKKLQNTLKNPAATDSGFVLPDDELVPVLLGYKTASTNQVPSNLIKGTGTNLSAAILANWSDVLLANWGVLEILSNPYGSADFERGSIAVRGMMTLDLGIRQPKSFVVCSDIVTT